MLIARLSVISGNSSLLTTSTSASSNRASLNQALSDRAISNTVLIRCMWLLMFWPCLLLLAGGNAWGQSDNRLDRLHAAADNLHWSLHQSDYSITTNDSCEYVVESANHDIRRVIYFDPDGNRHAVRRDHYGNRFGTSVNLADTALGGVVNSEGTLFIKLRNRYRWYGDRLIIRLDIPTCGANAPVCVATGVNDETATVPVGSDPQFVEHAKGNNDGEPGFSVTTATLGGGIMRCQSNAPDGSIILIEQPGNMEDFFQIFRLDASGLAIVDESQIPLSREESTACGVVLGCEFQ
jgi:hypothetical protein